MDTKDDLDQVLEKNSFRKTVQVTAWIRRFLKNCKLRKSAWLVGPLTTSETNQQVRWWLKRAQESFSGTEKLELNLQKKSQG